ncbi:MAG: sulfurtransferase complex subunit TusD [Cellvibrionaceae bacterium]
MKFTINIYCSPNTSPAADSAFRFAKTLIREGHEIYRVFFFNEGVLHCISHPHKLSLPEQWQKLILDHNVDAVICSASAEKRGITTDGRSVPLEGFTISGLGQLIDGVSESDRVISFG